MSRHPNSMQHDSSVGISIHSAIIGFIESIAQSRSPKTATAYSYGLKSFENTLRKHGFNPENDLTTNLPEVSIGWLASDLRSLTSATEQLYLTAVNNFFHFLAAEGYASPNLPRVENLKQKRMRRTGQRLPQFPREAIENIIIYANSLELLPIENEFEGLRNLRDRAFILTLADTGLRVHEACSLRRGDIDWYENRAIIIGKGDKQAVVRFSGRSILALKDYLLNRAKLDGASGRPLSSLPVFARHDKGAGMKVKPITTTTGRNIVSDRVKESLGEAAVGSITPHSFRHYFVTTVLRASGNLKMAQELARHKNISVTQRYAHLSDDELDKGYWEIFNSESQQAG
jgi:integrase/recombinase XerC